MSKLVFPDRYLPSLLESITPSSHAKAASEDIEGPLVEERNLQGKKSSVRLRLCTTTVFRVGAESRWVRLLPTREVLDFIWRDMGPIPDTYAMHLILQDRGSLLMYVTWNKIIGDRWLWNGQPQDVPVGWRAVLGLEVTCG